MTLEALSLTYGPPGGTDPAASIWSPPAGLRVHESHTPVAASWEEAATRVLAWGVKTRSGFRVSPTRGRLELGDRFHLIASIGPFRVREPVEVVAVVEEVDRVGFAYGTLEGHPVSGEEAFIAWRDSSGQVWLTLRSVTAPSRGVWRLAFPILLVVQRFYRARYQRALSR